MGGSQAFPVAGTWLCGNGICRFTGVLDSGLRRNDDGGNCRPPPIRHSRPPSPSFPRKRESTPPTAEWPGLTGVLDSGLRRNDGGGIAARRPLRHSRPPFVIPAKAGIHPPSPPHRRHSPNPPVGAHGRAPLPHHHETRPSTRHPAGPMIGRGVDSRFRGNDGVGGGSNGVIDGKRRPGAAHSPLPAGEGWVREKRPQPPTPKSRNPEPRQT